VTPLFSTAYLPPVSYIDECIRSGKIILEQHEHFVKQTIRNRAHICGANGMLKLIIPVQHQRPSRIPICDVKISYENAWQKIHWRSIASAYRNSPYFEFYEDEFAPFYHRRFETLFAFNLELMKKIFALLKANVDISFTSSYVKEPAEVTDFRNFPFEEKTDMNSEPYRQVFSDRIGFIAGLSIFDKICNVH